MYVKFRILCNLLPSINGGWEQAFRCTPRALSLSWVRGLLGLTGASYGFCLNFFTFMTWGYLINLKKLESDGNKFGILAVILVE